MITDHKKNENLVVLDVRSNKEYKNSHIPNAVNIELNKNYFKLIKLLDKSISYIVYSKFAMESKEAVMIMKDLEFERVLLLGKGFIGWEKMGLPIEK